LGEFAVGGQRAVQVGIDAQDVRQRHRIGVVGLRTSHRRPFPIAGHGHRVDRKHRAPTGTQGGDQQPARSFDRDRDRVLGAVAGVGEHPGQSGEPGRVVADALFGHQTPITADDCDVVMPFSPVDSAVAIQSSTSINSGVPLVRTPDQNAQRPTYEPLGLASDELFAIPAHPHGAGLSQSSMALDKIGGRLVMRAGSNHEQSHLPVPARPRRHAVPSRRLLGALPALGAHGLSKGLAAQANDAPTDPAPSLWIDLPAILF
jgi:hypothetical protein